MKTERLNVVVCILCSVTFVLQSMGYLAPAWFVREYRVQHGADGFLMDGQRFALIGQGPFDSNDAANDVDADDVMSDVMDSFLADGGLDRRKRGILIKDEDEDIPQDSDVDGDNDDDDDDDTGSKDKNADDSPSKRPQLNNLNLDLPDKSGTQDAVPTLFDNEQAPDPLPDFPGFPQEILPDDLPKDDMDKAGNTGMNNNSETAGWTPGREMPPDLTELPKDKMDNTDNVNSGGNAGRPVLPNDQNMLPHLPKDENDKPKNKGDSNSNDKAPMLPTDQDHVATPWGRDKTQNLDGGKVQKVPQDDDQEAWADAELMFGFEKAMMMGNYIDRKRILHVTAGLWYARACVNSRDLTTPGSQNDAGTEWCTMYIRTNPSTLGDKMGVFELRIEASLGVGFSLIGLLVSISACCSMPRQGARFVLSLVCLFISGAIMLVPVVHVIVQHHSQGGLFHRDRDWPSFMVHNYVRHDLFDHWSAILCGCSSLLSVLGSITLTLVGCGHQKPAENNYDLAKSENGDVKVRELPVNWARNNKITTPPIKKGSVSETPDSLGGDSDYHTETREDDCPSVDGMPLGDSNAPDVDDVQTGNGSDVAKKPGEEELVDHGEIAMFEHVLEEV